MSTLAEIKGWHSRGYLPHFDGGEVPQSITFRLVDSLPTSRLEQWAEEMADLPRDEADREYRVRIEAYLDRGLGQAWLKVPEVARVVEGALLYFDGQRYRLHAWVVMPNHVHALLTPGWEYSLSSILHSWKSFTAKAANRVLARTGDFWQEDYHDRYIRDEAHFSAAVHYIEENPVKAGLCATPAEWPFSSARLRGPGSAGVPPAPAPV